MGKRGRKRAIVDEVFRFVFEDLLDGKSVTDTADLNDVSHRNVYEVKRSLPLFFWNKNKEED